VEIWFQDEARVGQHGTLTRIWAKRGTRPRAPRDQRYTSAYIFGAVCPARRTTASLVMPHANAEALSKHMAEISKEVASGSHAMLLHDGAGYHIAADLVVPDNISLMVLPPYAPELNPVENIWAYLRSNKLANTVFDDYEHVVDSCCEAWNFFANDASVVASITTRTWAQVNV
jgi:transposase